MRRRWLLLAVTTALPACSSLPWTGHGEAPAECGPLLVPGTPLDWAGRGDVVSLGLPALRGDPGLNRDGDVYVGQADATRGVTGIPPGTRAYCVVYLDGVTVGPVPESWEPP